MKKGLKPRQPKTVEREYTRDLRRVSEQVSREIERATKKLNLDVEGIVLPEFYVDMGFAEDRVRAMMRSPKVSGIVDRQARRVSDWNAEEVSRVLRIKISRDSARVQALLESFRSENVDLITKMGIRQLDDMRLLVGQASTTGMRVETLRKRIQERFRVSKSRAMLIARDQTVTINSQLSRVRQTDAGVREYIWSASQDERVRDEHEALNGQRFNWAEGHPTEGHPGEPIQCRCTATPIIPSLEGI